MTQIDPRSPMVLDTKEVGRRPGSMAEVSREVEAPADFGTEVMAIAQGEPLDVQARLESVVEGVLVTGSVQGTATGACVRCLDPVSLDVAGRFQELFAYADRGAHRKEVGDDEAAEEHLIEDGLIDLEPVLRDAVVPSLPFQPVCRPDCPGLCSECGIHLEGHPDHAHETIDPRWAALSDLGSDPSTSSSSERT